MTIEQDTIGNYFLGDCIYANHNPSYSEPPLNYLTAHPETAISTELSALCTQAGLPYRNVLSQVGFQATPFSKCLLYFGVSGGIDDRYKFNGIWRGGNNTSSSGPAEMFNNAGATDVLNDFNISTNRLAVTEGTTGGVYGLNGGMSNNQFIASSVSVTPIYFAGVSDGFSLALFTYQRNLGTNSVNASFRYAGILDNINTNYNYYSFDNTTKSIILSGGLYSGTVNPETASSYVLNGRHYIGNAAKYIYAAGDAIYPIVCQYDPASNTTPTPTPTWATDFYVFDNNPALGYPAMGKVRNLLLAQGTFTIGKPVRIDGTIFPDEGFNCWLPVGTFAGKTVLMRCYTSIPE